MPPVLKGWSLDKHSTIGVVCAIVLQTVYFTYWGTSRYDEVVNRISGLEKSDDGQASHENRIVILEQQWTYIRSDLQEIKAILRATQGTNDKFSPQPPQQHGQLQQVNP